METHSAAVHLKANHLIGKKLSFFSRIKKRLFIFSLRKLKARHLDLKQVPHEMNYPAAPTILVYCYLLNITLQKMASYIYSSTALMYSFKVLVVCILCCYVILLYISVNIFNNIVTTQIKVFQTNSFLFFMLHFYVALECK